MLHRSLNNRRRRGTHLITSAVVWLFCTIGERAAIVLGGIVSSLVIFPFRLRVRLNLQKLFAPGNLDDDRYRRIIRDYIHHSGHSAAMVCRLPLLSLKDAIQAMPLEGENYLAESMEKGKGTVLIADHMGPFYLAPYILSARGYRSSVMINPNIKPIVDKTVDKFKINPVGIGESGHGTIAETLRDNDILFLWFDICQPKYMKRGLWLPLGGGEVLVDPGPSIIACRHTGPVLRIQCRLVEDNQYVLSISPLAKNKPDGGPLSPREMHGYWMESLYNEMVLRPGAWWPLASVPFRRRQPQPAYADTKLWTSNAEMTA